MALWAGLLKAFEELMSSKAAPSSELMNCVRLFLKDNGTDASSEQKAQLQELHRLLAGKLLDALNSEAGPSATTMETLRRFLADNHITKDISAAVDTRKGLELLQDLDLPFNQH